VTWVDWDDVDDTMLAFTESLTRFRKAHRAFLPAAAS